jgi:hypothetical protein
MPCVFYFFRIIDTYGLAGDAIADMAHVNLSLFCPHSGTNELAGWHN